MSIFTAERERRAQASVESQRQSLKSERDTSLQSITHTFTDGGVVQVRPQDIANFQLAISQGQSQDWVMADNSVRTTTVQELEEAMLSGIDQGKLVWKAYTEALKTMGEVS